MDAPPLLFGQPGLPVEESPGPEEHSNQEPDSPGSGDLLPEVSLHLSAGERFVQEALGVLLDSSKAGPKVGCRPRRGCDWQVAVQAERRQHDGRRRKYELHVGSPRSATPMSASRGSPSPLLSGGFRSPSPLSSQPAVQMEASLAKNIRQNMIWKGKAEIGSETNVLARPVYPVLRSATPPVPKHVQSPRAAPLLANGPQGLVKAPLGYKPVSPGTRQMGAAPKPGLFSRSPGADPDDGAGHVDRNIWAATRTESAASRARSPSTPSAERGANSRVGSPSPQPGKAGRAACRQQGSNPGSPRASSVRPRPRTAERPVAPWSREGTQATRQGTTPSAPSRPARKAPAPRAAPSPSPRSSLGTRHMRTRHTTVAADDASGRGGRNASKENGQARKMVDLDSGSKSVSASRKSFRRRPRSDEQTAEAPKSETVDQGEEMPADVNENKRVGAFRSFLDKINASPSAYSGKSSARSAMQTLRHKLSRDVRLESLDWTRKMRLDAGELSREDAARASSIFDNYSEARPERSGARIWTSDALLEALADFGAKARTRTEKQYMNQVLPTPEEDPMRFKDFCMTILEVRDKMQEATSVIVFNGWARADNKEKGFLDGPKMLDLLFELYPWLRGDRSAEHRAKEFMDECDRGDNKKFTFQEAEKIVWNLRELRESSRRAQERSIQSKYMLDDDIFKQFRGQLIELHEAFENFGTTNPDSDSGDFDHKRLLHMQSCFGLPRSRRASSTLFADQPGNDGDLDMSMSGPADFSRSASGSLDPARPPQPRGLQREATMGDEWWRQAGVEENSQAKEDEEEDNDERWFSANGALSKSKFEQVLVRCMTERVRQIQGMIEELKAAFNSYDKDRSGELEMREVCCILEDVGLLPKTAAEQQAIAQMIDEVDTDGSGRFDFEEFCFLMQRVQESFAQISYQDEEKEAMDMNLSRTQVRHLREVFYYFDGSSAGSLDRQAVMRAIVKLGFRLPGSTMKDVLHSIQTRRRGHFQFLEFLKVFKAVEQEALSRALGASDGISAGGAGAESARKVNFEAAPQEQVGRPSKPAAVGGPGDKAADIVKRRSVIPLSQRAPLQPSTSKSDVDA